MESSSAKITILFEDPLWIGLYERQEGDRYTVCKITFCAEPKNYEVYAFLMHNFSRLQFSPPVFGCAGGAETPFPEMNAAADSISASFDAGWDQSATGVEAPTRSGKRTPSPQDKNGAGNRAGSPVCAPAGKAQRETQRTLKNSQKACKEPPDDENRPAAYLIRSVFENMAWALWPVLFSAAAAVG